MNFINYHAMSNIEFQKPILSQFILFISPITDYHFILCINIRFNLIDIIAENTLRTNFILGTQQKLSRFFAFIIRIF